MWFSRKYFSLSVCLSRGMRANLFRLDLLAETENYQSRSIGVGRFGILGGAGGRGGARFRILGGANSQQEHDVVTRRRCDVTTSHRRHFDVMCLLGF